MIVHLEPIHTWVILHIMFAKAIFRNINLSFKSVSKYFRKFALVNPRRFLVVSWLLGLRVRNKINKAREVTKCTVRT